MYECCFILSFVSLFAVCLHLLIMVSSL